jgi:methylmalonyl-CoA/ethylmalonyl-CoA epimerase
MLPTPEMNRLTHRRASGGASAARPMRENGGGDTLGTVKLLNLDHVAIAVHDLDATVDGYRKRYNVEPLYRETVESQGVEEAMIPVGGSFIQLLRPLDPETPVGRFLSKQGEGLHHVAYAVVSIEAALAHLAEQGANLIDTEPGIGGRGARIAFVHPADLGGTLIELVELSDE